MTFLITSFQLERTKISLSRHDLSFEQQPAPQRIQSVPPPREGLLSSKGSLQSQRSREEQHMGWSMILHVRVSPTILSRKPLSQKLADVRLSISCRDRLCDVGNIVNVSPAISQGSIVFLFGP